MLYNLPMNNKKAFTAVLMAVIVGMGCGKGAEVRDDSQVAPVAAAVQPAADAPTLAIVKLKAQGVTEDEAGLVTDMLREAIAQKGKYRVVEREQMERIMAEKAMAMADMTSDTAQAGVAKLLNARYMGIGSFGKLMGNYVLSFRLVDNESGLMKGAGTAEGADLKEIKKGIARMVASF